MTAETNSPLLTAGSLLIAPGTPVPPKWLRDQNEIPGGWSRVTNQFDALQLDKDLTAIGWTFFYMAGAITSTTFGFSAAGRLDAGLAKLIDAAARKHCNCLQIDSRGSQSFLGVPYLSLAAHPRHIQKGSTFRG